MDEITNDSIETVQTAETPDVSDVVEKDTAEQRDEVPEIGAEQTTADGEETKTENGDTKKRKKPLPPKIQKIVDYLNTHEDVRQMVFFLMFSVLCGASQMIVTYALSAGLKLASSLSSNFDWFVFHFATTAEFIGFLVGSIVGQVLTFVLNRKKTFNMPDYVALRAVMYAILAILIIIMQTYLGGLVTNACHNAKPDANGFLDLVFNLTGQLVAGIAAVIINFLGNKFLVMRDWSKLLKKNKGESAGATAETATAETTEATANAETAHAEVAAAVDTAVGADTAEAACDISRNATEE